MGDPKQVKAVIKSIKDFSNFRNMVEYNISCLLTYITPPTVGWRENVKAAVEDGGIESIISVLNKHPQALALVKQATTALSGIAINKENAGEVAAKGGIEAALNSMMNMRDNKAKEVDEVIDSGAKLMETVARFNPQAIMKSPEAVNAMLKGVNYSDVPRVQIASAKVLDRVGANKQGVKMIVDKNGIPMLISAMAPGTETHEDMLTPMFRLLERMAKSPEYVAMIRKAGGVEALVYQLDRHSDNELILRAGGRLLGKLADGDIEETIRKMGANLPDAVKQHLVGLLANLALQPENVDKIVKAGGIQALLQNFNSFPPLTKAAALRALQRIADAGPAYAHAIVEQGGLPVIIGAINGANGNEDILKAATQALTSIAASGLDMANMIAKLGGIDAIFGQMMKFPNLPGFAGAGLDFIDKLCAIGFDIGDLVKRGAVEATLAVMAANMEDAAVQEKGFKALSALLSGADPNAGRLAAQAILSSKNIGVLPESMVNHAGAKGVVKGGVAALAKLIGLEPAAKGVLSEIGTLDAVVISVHEQLKLEMLGMGRFTGDTTNLTYVKALINSLSDASTSGGVSKGIASAPDKTIYLKRAAVFALDPESLATMLNGQVAMSLSKSLVATSQNGVGDKTEEIVDHSVAIWSIAKASREGMDELANQGAIESLLATTQTQAKNATVVIAGYRSLNIFASNYIEALLQLKAVENCVAGMRSNPQRSDVQLAAIDLMLSLSTSEVGATKVVENGGIRQVNKMISESSSSPEFEKAVEKGIRLMYITANIDKAFLKDMLKKQGTVKAVTDAMSAYPSNSEILKLGGRVLAVLMDEEDVAQTIDDVAKLTDDLVKTSKPDTVFDPLGQKVATVGFLSLNPANKKIMAQKNAVAITGNSIQVSKSKPLNGKREIAVRNEFRAIGQLAAAVEAPPGVVDSLLKNLAAPYDTTSLIEKAGILEAIKYMSADTKLLGDLLNKGSVQAILALMADNRSDQDILLAGLDALSGLMSNDAGVQLVTQAGGRDLILAILKDDPENLSPGVAEAALVALKKLAANKINAAKLAEDGVVDAVTSTLAVQIEEGNETRPKLLGAAAGLLNALGHDPSLADKIVKSGALKKIVDIAMSSPDYMRDADCMKNIASLLDTLSNIDGLLDKMRDIGAIDLIMRGMDLNAGNDEIKLVGQRVLQKLIGGDATALEPTLKTYDDLLAAIKKKPNNVPALGRLRPAAVNLANLMLVEGVVDAKGAKAIVARAVDTFDFVDGNVSDKVGPIKEQILDIALQTIGRANLVDGALAAIDMNDALDVLSRSLDSSSAQLQIQGLTALTNFMNEDPRYLDGAIKRGLIAKLQKIMANSSSPEVKAAAEKALENIRHQIALHPEKLLSLGARGDEELATILKTINDPKDLEDLLLRLSDAPYGADALLRLALNDIGGLGSELRKDILNALAQAPPGVLTIPPELMGRLFARIQDPNIDPDEKAALLRLLGETKISPASAAAIMANKGVDSLLNLLRDENADPNLVAAALNALGQMSNDPMLAKYLLDMAGAETIVDAMKRFKGNKQIQALGFNALANLEQTVGGPEKIDISPDSFNYLKDALDDLDPLARSRANKLVDDLANLYGGQVEPMVINRFDNLLDLLREAREWRELHDPKTGKPYYYNVVTKETTWNKPPALIAAERAALNLQSLAEKAPADIDSDKIRQMVGLFDDHAMEPLRLKALAKALAALAANDRNRDAMVNHGVLEAIIKAMNGQNIDREFILAAIALLNQFAKHKVYKEQICRIGGIKALIAIMLRYITDEEIVEKCEQCLANLAFNSVLCIEEIMVCQGPAAVGKALDNHRLSKLVCLNAMQLLSNLMYKNNNNKKLIGDLLRDKIVEVLKRMYKDAAVFKQTARAIGNIAFVDEHIRYVVGVQTVKCLVAGMNVHANDPGLLQLAVDVIGNFASIDEKAVQDQIVQGRLVSVTSIIWVEGGAKKIVDLFGESSDAKLVASCVRSLVALLKDEDVGRKLIGMGVVPMIFSAMSKFDWDQNISDFCIEAIELLATKVEGVQSIYDNNGIPTLLQQLDLNMARPDYVEIVIQSFYNMARLKDGLSVKVLSSLIASDGIDTILKALESHSDDADFVLTSVKLFILMAAKKPEASEDIAQKGMRIFLNCVAAHKQNAEVLFTVFQLLGLLAFEQKNLKVIVQYGGINLIIDSILTFPENAQLVARSIQTLDNIAMGSEEHSNIVRQARGKDVIEELIRTYEKIKEPQAQDVVNACRAALLSMSKIEAKRVQPILYFTNKDEDPNIDPLKNFRTLLLTGETLTLYKGMSSRQVHVYIRPDFSALIYKVPGANKPLGKVDLKAVVGVKQGVFPGHGRNADFHNSFAITTADKKMLCFEARDTQQRDQWCDALDALRKAYRANSKWLQL